MCRYSKKRHTCGHESDWLYIEMCHPGFMANAVCPDISGDSTPRSSHFPCYNCIKAEARAEIETRALLEQEAVAKAIEAKEKAIKEKQAADFKAKEERIRREAKEKAIREREEELRVKREKEEQEQRAKKEGGLWIETANLKNRKGRKGGANGGPPTPLSAPAIMKTVTDKKENSPKKDRNIDTGGGRVGHWGPKKILSRKENANVGATGGGGSNGNANAEAK
ncbi:hypothetical protein N0V83_006748 [Neocucurbitaria cava]|uniref:Uncharacterized protein n=1 Tax=Neocucurbitaria cava TaxID=798079 RepID=A0A9W8Y5M9_9PLEO|nr:hypothetical protein N0V83_006748 [Neocucurbitaria cava]